jgi:restriction system protein
LFILAILVCGLLSYAANYVGWPAVIVAVVVVAVLIGRYLIRKATLSTPKAQDLSVSLQNVGAMSGGQFEVFVAQVLRALGYRTTVLGGSGDQGVDIIAASQGGKVAVQCKNYRKPVGNKPVQEGGGVATATIHSWFHPCSSTSRPLYPIATSLITAGLFIPIRRQQPQLSHACE